MGTWRDFAAIATNVRGREDVYYPAIVSRKSLLHQVWALPGFTEEVDGQERQHGLVPDHGVARTQDPVVLVREVQELHVRGPARPGGQPGPQAQRLPDGDPVVLVTVDHQHRGGDRIEVVVGRVRQVALRVRERVTEVTPPVRGHVGRAE